MEKIPIIKIDKSLLVTIQGDLYDAVASQLQDDLMNKIYATKAKGILIDISAVEILDSFMGRIISNITQMSKLLDAKTVVVGMQPAVAITLVELGLTLEGVHTAINVEKGIKWLDSVIEKDENPYKDKEFLYKLTNEREDTPEERSTPDPATE